MNQYVKMPLLLGLIAIAGVAAVGAVANTANPITHGVRESMYSYHLVTQYRDVQQGNVAAAIDEDTAMISLFPTRFEPYMLRAMAYSAQGQRRQAIEDDTASLKCLPDDKDLDREVKPGCEETCRTLSTGTIHYNRAVDEQAMNKNRPAVEDIDQALQIDPNEKDAHFVRAQAYLELKEYRKAVDDCDWSIQHGDNNPDHIYFVRAQALAGCGDYKKAVEAMHQAIAARADLHYLLSYLGWYQYKAGMVSDAIATDQKALSFSDNRDASPAFNLGLCYVMTGDEAKAHAAYEQALQMSPSAQNMTGGRQDIVDELKAHPGHPLLLKAQLWIEAK